VIGIGIAGIVVTHKIAGPIFKMKRLMREVGEGKLVIREGLRSGDELQHLFLVFKQMVDRMRENQKGEIARIDEILEKLGKDKDRGIADLKTLRADMHEHLQA